LAVIAEISFKVRPRLGKTVTAIARFDRATDANAVVSEIRRSSLTPISCELVGPGHAVAVRFEEHPKAIPGQIAKLPPAQWKVFEGDDEIAVHDELRGRYASMGPVVVRVVCLPTEIGAIVETYQPSAWIAHAMNGIVLMALPDAERIPAIRERYEAVIERAPLETRRRVGTFGVRGRTRQLMEDMKKSFDPEMRLNPGRHVDGE
jgi:FAD/FMN-containing dehydrogenase